jgi:hypothetical protein
MTAFHVALGTALIAVNLAAGLWGVWCWWRVRPAPGFWPMLRAGQALVVLQAVDGGILLLADYELPELHLIYGLVPFGVAFLAEQLRVAAAGTVLAQRGLEGRADVERLPRSEQHELIRAIVRREVGVMAASALVIAVLGIRASGLV